MMKTTLTKLAATAITLAALTEGANATIMVNFSGGNNSPLTVTFPEAIKFELTKNFSNTAMIGIDLGQTPNWGFGSSVGATANFTVKEQENMLFSGTSPNWSPYSNIGVGFEAAGFFAISGIRVFGGSAGGSVTLAENFSITTNTNESLATPTSGNYNVYIIDSNLALQTSAATVAPVPEPSSALLLGLGSLSLLARRKRKA